MYLFIHVSIDVSVWNSGNNIYVYRWTFHINGIIEHVIHELPHFT